MSRPAPSIAIATLVLLATVCSPVIVAQERPSDRSPANPLTAEQRSYFENQIRPVLVKHCYSCHSADAKEIGGNLRLDHREGLLQGGESGAALVRGNPDESLLVQAMRYEGPEMPPDQPLSPSIVRDFADWVERGAFDPRSEVHPTGEQTPAEDQSPLWSLQPVTDPSPPTVSDREWPRDVIDQYVLARIEKAGLSPAADADARSLVRRLYFDLTGLPPTASAVARYVQAVQRDGQAGLRRLVDHLLCSPRFGERWGRHWLDVARYGESNGNDGLSRNPTFPHAWRYRDYVITSLNSDTPYDTFLMEQVAGDLLPTDSAEQRDRHLIATGLLAMASKPAKAMNNNFDMDVVADQIDLLGRGVMGLSIGCARCHDHKFDPVSTRDYYALAGIFTSTETMWGLAANEKLTAPPTDLHVLTAAKKVLPPTDFVETVILRESATGKPKKIPASKWPPGTPLAMGVRDRAKPADCKLNIDGDAKKLGEVVPRGFLSSLVVGDAWKVDPQQSGRLQLARWITDPEHPLTSRVIVNRIWMHLMGRGLVQTPDDFGVYGQPPTHPLLLDHLATRFVRQGWSIKQIIRGIVLSRTYQLSSEADLNSLAADPENRWLARHTRRRLDAEEIRDRMLMVSGELDLGVGTASIIRHRDIMVNLAGNLHRPSHHRSVYLCYLRSSPPPELAAFNLPDFTSVTGRRDESTVPAQALYLLNSPFVIGQADRLARLVVNHSQSFDTRLTFAFRRTLDREPNGEEFAAAIELLRSTKRELKSEHKAWASLCQSLLVTSEFRYVD